MVNKYLLSVAVAILIPLMIMAPARVLAYNCPAQDDQCPDQQITSSNTSNDFNSWARISMAVSHSFQFTSGTDHEFDFQLNALVNGETNCYPTCPYTWWVQAFVDVANTYSGVSGAWVMDSGIQVDASVPNICVFQPTPPNIGSQTGWNVQDEFFLVSATQVKSSLTITQPNGHVYYTTTSTCTYNGTEAVYYMSQVEGVVVGASSPEHASFTPLQTQIFSGYYELFSNFNHMSSSPMTIQTSETSNLYQTSFYSASGLCSSGTCKGLYYYSETGTENTKSDS